eukprot:CAMPEP_0202103246 /NCGR_PEP_ID=MMETSP0965-20130614/4781_1 /ASSEMBLY_ACC=CAM_ASM_000507 /TAXON_ID=4773 /ORGANISM="Schizochytrium aggregatum, Strain ATCC28209" /LENGTH=412 /DNA_ID=CAMNT_0048672039 /DNA_START=56 /DNA_END=1294 /DNA_ORIENTATION=+
MSGVLKRLSKRLSGNRDGDMAKLKELQKQPYKEQAIWFLNAFWNNDAFDKVKFMEDAEACETVWKFCQECISLDPKDGEGNELDEVLAHRLLEKIESVLTVVEMREVMRKIDVDFNRRVSLFEFLFYKFDADWRLMVNSVKEQGGDEMKAMLAETQALVDEAKAQLEECQKLAQQALEAENHARAEAANAAKQEELAKEAEEACREAEEAFIVAENAAKEAEAEEQREADKLAAAVAECKAEEEAYENQKVHLETQSKRESIGIVKRGKAANEYHQLLATETVGMREARIRQEAALRRQQKAVDIAAAARAAAEAARQPFKEATEAAEQARKDAEEARAAADQAAVEAEKAREDADAAVETSMQAFNEAIEAMEAIKAEFANANQGRFWWMERELEHAKQFMSKKQLAALAK